jgi:hypothetical protein
MGTGHFTHERWEWKSLNPATSPTRVTGGEVLRTSYLQGRTRRTLAIL